MYDGQPSNHETVAGLIGLTNCKKNCPDDCINDGDWEYYDSDSSDPNNQWRTDPLIRLTCVDGQNEFWNDLV